VPDVSWITGLGSGRAALFEKMGTPASKPSVSATSEPAATVEDLPDPPTIEPDINSAIQSTPQPAGASSDPIVERREPKLDDERNSLMDFGKKILATAFPEMYATGRAVGGVLEKLYSGVAAVEEGAKRDRAEGLARQAEYRRDVDTLRFDLGGTNAVLKQNTSLLQQEVQLTTRGVSLLHDILGAVRNGRAGVGGWIEEALAGVGLAGVVKGAKPLIRGAGVKTAVALAAITGLALAITAFYNKLTERAGKTEPAPVPGLRPPAPADDSSALVHKTSYAPSRSDDSNNSDVVTIRAGEVRYVADRMVFDADTMTFASSSSTGGGQAGSLIQGASYGGGSFGGLVQRASFESTPALGAPGGGMTDAGGGVGAPLIRGSGSGSAGGTPPQPQLSPQQQSAVDALSKGPVSASSDQARVFSGMSQDDLSAAGIQKTGEGDRAQYSFSKGAESIAPEEAARSLADKSGMFKSTSVPYEASAITKEMGITQKQYDAFKEGVTDIEGKRYDRMGGSGGRFAGRYQMGMLGRTEVSDAARRLGIPVPTQQEFLSNPALQEKIFENYTLDHYHTLMKNPKFAAMSKEQQLEVLGYAHNQGTGSPTRGGGAWSYLESGQVGRDAWGTSGTAYMPKIRARLAQAQAESEREAKGGFSPQDIQAERSRMATQRNVDRAKSALLNQRATTRSADALHDMARPKPVSPPSVPPPVAPRVEAPGPVQDINYTVSPKYHHPDSRSTSLISAMNVEHKPPGLSPKYYAYLYPHLYGDKAVVSPETRNRTA